MKATAQDKAEVESILIRFRATRAPLVANPAMLGIWRKAGYPVDEWLAEGVVIEQKMVPLSDSSRPIFKRGV